MPILSAGLLMYRRLLGCTEVLLGHPGGPLWARKNIGAWTIPKGLINDGEDPLTAALREYREETSFASTGPYLDLGEVFLKSGKRVRAWAFSGDCDPASLTSNSFEMEWPPRSRRRQSFPEIDRYEFFASTEAATRIIAYQAPLLARLAELLAGHSEPR